MSFLLGNSFPFTLIRHPVIVEPVSLKVLKEHLRDESWESFWGHGNTLKIASSMLEVDLSPRVERPAISLNEIGLPVLYGKSYQECWLFSPDYRSGFRPSVGEEVRPEDIISWQVLRITWKN